MGSESSGGIKDVFIHDNIIGVCEQGSCLDKCCGWGPALHLKTTLTRGQFIENVVFKDNTIHNNTGFIDMETNYQTKSNTPPTGVYVCEDRTLGLQRKFKVSMSSQANATALTTALRH